MGLGFGKARHHTVQIVACELFQSIYEIFWVIKTATVTVIRSSTTGKISQFVEE
jgi:hypothetical protein